MRYLVGLIVLPEKKNVSSINRSFVEYRNQASMNNFITNSTWDDEEFHKTVGDPDGQGREARCREVGVILLRQEHEVLGVKEDTSDQGDALTDRCFP